MANLKVIGKVTVGAGGQAAIEFTNIPATYTDLAIKMSVRCAATSPTRVYVRFNGASTDANLTTVRLYGEASSAGSDSISAGQPAWANGTSTTANTFNNAEFYIPNYLSSNSKSFSADTVQENNASGQAYLGLFGGLWSSSSAITQINLLMQDSSNFLQHSTVYLYGISSVTTGSKATGGIVSSDGTYYYHMFPYSGTFTPTQSLTADYLVVAGGGAGSGGDGNGGAGAGGLRSTVGVTGGGGSLESPLSLTAQPYAVIIGAGGATSTTTNATKGSNSVFSTITANGGGASPPNAVGSNNTNGGSGAGCTYESGYAYTPGVGTANQGYNGGDGAPNSGALGSLGGGGGGAGAVGVAGTGSGAGAGGNGVQITTLATPTGTGANSGYYAGGGGGGVDTRRNSSVGAGGLGGGGGGNTSATATAGTANTGGGGGGGTYNYAFYLGGNGGSGIVIIRYAI